MYIYKITNIINNKIYIGQSIRDISKRFHRHIQDAETGRLNTHLARAIRKYGKRNFIIEEIDTATSQEELNKKENYWIHYYNTLENGYNETDSVIKSGGNTYASKTEEEKKEIKEKIRQTKLGGKNPMARKVKCINVNTNEEHHFDSLADMKLFFDVKNHDFITKRCSGQLKNLYKGEWNIAYEENDYKDRTPYKNNSRAITIKVKNLETEEEKEFPSFAAAERYFELPLKYFSSKAYRHGDHFIKGNFEITKISN